MTESSLTPSDPAPEKAKTDWICAAVLAFILASAFSGWKVPLIAALCLFVLVAVLLLVAVLILGEE